MLISEKFEKIRKIYGIAQFTILERYIILFDFRTYFVVASKMVRPGQLFRVSVTLLQQKRPITVRASIQRNGVEVSADHKDVKVGIPETLLMKVNRLFFVLI